MQQSETNTLANALVALVTGSSSLTTLATSDVIEVRNSSGALKGKITADNLRNFVVGTGINAGVLKCVYYSSYTADTLPLGSICYVPNGGNVTFETDFNHSSHRNVYITNAGAAYGNNSSRASQICVSIPTSNASEMMIRSRLLTGKSWGAWVSLPIFAKVGQATDLNDCPIGLNFFTVVTTTTNKPSGVSTGLGICCKRNETYQLQLIVDSEATYLYIRLKWGTGDWVVNRVALTAWH